MDTVLATIFTDYSAESQNMRLLSDQNGEDIMDLPLTLDQLGTFLYSPNYYVTSGANSEGGFSEIEFNLATNFWGST